MYATYCDHSHTSKQVGYRQYYCTECQIIFRCDHTEENSRTFESDGIWNGDPPRNCIFCRERLNDLSGRWLGTNNVTPKTNSQLNPNNISHVSHVILPRQIMKYLDNVSLSKTSIDQVALNITRIINSKEFTENPQEYMHRWQIRRGNNEIFIFPEDISRFVIEGMINDMSGGI